MEKHKQGLITTIRNNTDNTTDNRMTITRKQKWEPPPTLWAFQTTIKQHLTRENLDVAKKRKRSERNKISPNGRAKQRHKNQSYQSDKNQQNSKFKLCSDKD